MTSQESTLPTEPLTRLKDRMRVPEERLPSSLRPGSNASLSYGIAVIGNHIPRQCGIATFTTDLCNAIGEEYKKSQIMVVAVNDPESHFEYPSRVRFELLEGDSSSYEDAADFLNSSNVDMVSLQHEYGIYGGPANQRVVMEEVVALSDRLVVMSKHSLQSLQEVFHAPEGKIDLIPHGVPDLPFADPNLYKASMGAEGKTVLLTLGLLSPNKGIERVIEALPHIVADHPEVVYVVVGATHPHIWQREGDKYRLQLQSLAKTLGVERNVIFHNRFVRPDEMAQFVGSADIYITPYPYEEQAVSGTLAYALGAGKAIISTPYWHAAELLADGRGVLVPFEDSDAIATAAIKLLDNEMARKAMSRRAYLYAREMVWNKAAESYMSTFVRARSDRIASTAYRVLESEYIESIKPVVTHHASPVLGDRATRVSAA